MQNNKSESIKHKEITSIDEAYKILYTQNQDIIPFIPTLSQVKLNTSIYAHEKLINFCLAYYFTIIAISYSMVKYNKRH